MIFSIANADFISNSLNDNIVPFILYKHTTHTRYIAFFCTLSLYRFSFLLFEYLNKLSHYSIIERAGKT